MLLAKLIRSPSVKVVRASNRLCGVVGGEELASCIPVTGTKTTAPGKNCKLHEVPQLLCPVILASGNSP